MVLLPFSWQLKNKLNNVSMASFLIFFNWPNIAGYASSSWCSLPYRPSTLSFPSFHLHESKWNSGLQMASSEEASTHFLDCYAAFIPQAASYSSLIACFHTILCSRLTVVLSSMIPQTVFGFQFIIVASVQAHMGLHICRASCRHYFCKLPALLGVLVLSLPSAWAESGEFSRPNGHMTEVGRVLLPSVLSLPLWREDVLVLPADSECLFLHCEQFV